MTVARSPIGVFDSGFGGMAILKEIEKALPQYDYIYLGDTARAPYGSRSEELIYEFTLQAIEFLFNHNCALIIIACNTASAEALRKIQQTYLAEKYPGRRILGVIIPAVEEAIARTKNARIGVLGTEGTIRSKKFVRELQKLRTDVEVFQQAAPLLVPLVEEGVHKTEAARLILKSYLDPLLAQDIDTLILGCTHYGHLEEEIKKMVGEQVQVVSEGRVVAQKLKEYLTRHPDIESHISHENICTFYTTDMTDRFQQTGNVLFGRAITPLRTVLG